MVPRLPPRLSGTDLLLLVWFWFWLLLDIFGRGPAAAGYGGGKHPGNKGINDRQGTCTSSALSELRYHSTASLSDYEMAGRTKNSSRPLSTLDLRPLSRLSTSSLYSLSLRDSSEHRTLYNHINLERGISGDMHCAGAGCL